MIKKLKSICRSRHKPPHNFLLKPFTLAVSLSFIFALTLGHSLKSHAATLIVEGGILTGAIGITVDGSLYDVTFIDDVCSDVFSQCDSGGFLFESQEAASLASTALLSEVFLDSPAGNFDSSPDSTFGCSSLDGCTVLTPFGDILSDGIQYLFYVETFNNPGSDGIAIQLGDQDIISQDLALDGSKVWAKWELTAVPLPAAACLFLSAIGGLGILRFRVKP